MSLTLLDWRRRVAEMYADVRRASGTEPDAALTRFRASRDQLFAEHPDSPVPASARPDFDGLRYWAYDPGLRFIVAVEPLEPVAVSATSISGASFALRRIGRVSIPLGTLEVYWIDVYGGGIFVPFRDATSGRESYAAGRYLLDTVKGADLGGDGDGLVIDFNYAYHPSCAFDRHGAARWRPARTGSTWRCRPGSDSSGHSPVPSWVLDEPRAGCNPLSATCAAALLQPLANAELRCGVRAGGAQSHGGSP